MYINIIKRLNQLIELCDKEASTCGDVPVQEESLHSALSFLMDNPDLKAPDIGCGPNGHICFVWREDKDHNVTIEFQNAQKARYVVFCIHEGEQVRYSASTHPLNIMPLILGKWMGSITWLWHREK